MLQTFTKPSFIGDSWSFLQSRLQGTVIVPDDQRYDQARLAWNLAVNQQPAGIVVPKSAADVIEAVRFARSEGLSIAVQATGHGNVRPADGSLLILTSDLQGVEIDAQAQTAWVEAGVKWGVVLAKAQAAGLAPLLGSSPDVGAVGYTLGGGMGWLGRKYGLSADNVNYFEVVTTDGQLRRVSATENSDLFWGLRGGGGSLAIVTGMEIKLYPVTTVYGGNLFYSIEQAKAVISHYREWLPTVPDELTSSVVIMNFPPIPEMPDFLRGQSFVMIRGAYTGPVEQGEALLEYWRTWQKPVIDDFKALPFTQAAAISNDPVEPMAAMSSSAWLRELSDEAIDILIDHLKPANGSPLAFAEVRHAGGAIARPQATAYSNRDAQLSLQVVGAIFSPESHQALKGYVAQFKQALQPYLTGQVYMNFLEGTESQEQIRNGYAPEAYERLTQLKAKYDPDNVLAYGFNIQPAGK
ncbi:MAG: FAD-binding oxidoreductase [Anaerolineaceae bacterium]|nr:FAD-binding oxidoreductase [Anaerolineaceae bacterium]MCB9101873.1 FAD-binding oxidoreductase [Anaerolineales bacterium]